MSLLREAAWHLGARVFSAVASTSVFALLARVNTAADAKAVFFFLFVTGFLVAFLRSFCAISAQVMGSQRRSERLRRVHRMAGHYRRLSLVFAAFCVAVLWFQAVPPAVVLLAAACLVMAGLDGDQLRAALGRSAMYSNVFAAGSVLSLTALLMGAGRGTVSGALVILCPWLLMAAANAWPAWRLWRSARLHARRQPAQGPWVATLLTALYDGTVLNLPFLAGSRLGDAAGLDLSISMRLFSSAQPLFPLVMHWVSSGRLTEIAARLGRREAPLFALMLALAGLTASVIFVVLYALVGGKGVSPLQYGLFALLIVSYSVYAAGVRYVAPGLPAALRTRQVAVLLAGCVLLWFALSPWLVDSAAAVVALQCAGLLGLAGSSAWLLRRLKETF
jgi:hypothetical protein